MWSRFNRGRWGRGNRGDAAGGGGEARLPLGQVLRCRDIGNVLGSLARCEGKLNPCLLLAA